MSLEYIKVGVKIHNTSKTASEHAEHIELSKHHLSLTAQTQRTETQLIDLLPLLRKLNKNSEAKVSGSGSRLESGSGSGSGSSESGVGSGSGSSASEVGSGSGPSASRVGLSISSEPAWAPNTVPAAEPAVSPVTHWKLSLGPQISNMLPLNATAAEVRAEVVGLLTPKCIWSDDSNQQVLYLERPCPYRAPWCNPGHAIHATQKGPIGPVPCGRSMLDPPIRPWTETYWAYSTWYLLWLTVI